MIEKLFNKVFDTSIATKLKISYAFIVGVTLIIGIFSAINILQITSLLEKIHKHSFIVNNVVRDMNFDIIDMHRTMKDVTLSKNNAELNAAILKVDRLEKQVINNFDIVNKHFLGDPKEVQNKYQMFINWRPIRNEIITLSKENKKEIAAEITKNKGARYVQKLNEGMSLLINFTNNKANQVFNKVEEEENVAIFLIVLYILFILPLSIYILRKITNNISEQIKTVGKNLNGFFSLLQENKNISVAPIIYKHDDEFGKMISSINKNISISTQMHEEINKQTKEMQSLLSSFDRNVIASSTDKKGIISYASEAFCTISGYMKSELIGKNHNILRHPDMSNELYKNLWQTIKRGNTWRGEIKNKKKDGSFYWVDVVITPKFDSDANIIGYSAVRQDITSKKEVEELSKNLESKVAERTKDLKDANKKLKGTLKDLTDTRNDLIAAEKMANLGELVSSITHEINSPLGVSITTASLLKDNVNRIDTLYANENMSEEEFKSFIKDTQEISEILSINLNNTHNLVKSFKNVAVDQATEEKREFNIKQYIFEILLALKSKTKKTKIDIDVLCEDTIVLYSYPGYISQILTNLINNSILHGFDLNEVGKIIITINDLQENIEIIYADTGKGIPNELQDKIFEQYFTTKKGKGGTGLGLYIIKEIVNNKLHGNIKMDNAEDNGFNLKINIPKSIKDGVK